MKVYLAMFTKGERVALKIGHTKWFIVMKRFDHPQYDIFDNIVILEEIEINDPDSYLARKLARIVEATLQAVYPKNFRLEEHFKTEPNTFDGLSGITEMFIMEESTNQIRELFKRTARNVTQVLTDRSYIND